MAPGDTARTYHRLSSYDPGREWDVPVDDPRVVQDFAPNDLATFPAHSKTYADSLPTVALPRTWEPGRNSAAALLAGQAAPGDGVLDLTRLARILHLTAGVVRVAERKDGRRYRFRAAGSAGGQFPYEVYVASHGIDGLPDGVHWFDPLDHALVQVGPAPDGDATTIILTGVPWRTGWRYAERGFRHLYWDAGSLLTHAVLLAEDAGLEPRLRTVFPDAAVTRLVGADGVQEFPLAILTFGDSTPAIAPTGGAVSGEVDQRPPREFPLITETQRAGDGDVLGDPLPLGSPVAGRPPDAPPPDEVILLRASTRLMDPAASVSRELLAWMLAVAMRGCDVPHFIAVHAVDGLEPGVYRWPSLATPVRTGNLREELFFVCLEQELGRDAAFVVIGAADLSRLDDRGYREAQFKAGMVDGRLHLAAFAQGIGATGMTFLDSEMESLLGTRLEGLLFTCVGVPAYRHRPGGMPGNPTVTRPLRPRSVS